jgi:8-oxo-dGTP diphosphatase
MEASIVRPVPVVRLIVEDQAGRVLALQRTADSTAGGRWHLPGGKVDSGETAEQAAARELLEETGMVANDLVFLFYQDNLPPEPGRMHCRNFYFRCRADGEPVLNEESTAAAWIAPAELPAYNLAFRNDEGVARYWAECGAPGPLTGGRLNLLLALGMRAGVEVGGEPAMALPVLIVAGGADGMSPELTARIRPVLKNACEGFKGTILAGGTRSGVAGAMGDAALQTPKRQYRLIGYRPLRLPEGLSHDGYDEHRTTDGDFSADQILAYWRDLLDAGVRAKDVRLLGIGGGELSALEYRIALSFGASVGLVAGSGGSAAELLADPLWSGTADLYELPFDTAAIAAFVGWTA